jgi:hypothetical protein
MDSSSSMIASIEYEYANKQRTPWLLALKGVYD